MIDIASGHTAIDRYLADGYGRVPGMSSRSLLRSAAM